jgi:hypothetical protein
LKCPNQVFIEIKDDLKKSDGSNDDEAIAFWEAHMNIKDIGFSKPNIDILENDPQKTRLIIERLANEIQSIQHIFLSNGIDVPVLKEREKQIGIDY